MTQLPRALSRWRGQLCLFDEELAVSLGRLVQKLAPAVDAMTIAGRDETGEVDGFDGIARRGTYERLLATEWALREAQPLEFLRRALSGEHAFLQLARHSAAEPRGTLAIFDAGPDQLGACRVAQLAILVLLAERAESRREPFEWQLVHHLEEKPRGGLNEEGVRAFLAARTGLRSSGRAVQDWVRGYPSRQLWFVGSERLVRHAPEAAVRLTVTERVCAQGDFVDAMLTRGKATSREVALELPDPATAARLLRTPFGAKRGTATGAPLAASNLLLSPDGRRLYYRARDGALIAVSIPNSVRAGSPRPKRYQPSDHSTIASVGGHGRKAAWLGHTKSHVSVHFAAHVKASERAAPCPSPTLEPPASLSPFAWFAEERMAAFIAADRSLWRADFRTSQIRRIAEGVRSLVLARGRSLVSVERWLERTDAIGAQILELKPFWATVFAQPSSRVRPPQLRARAEGGYVFGGEDASGAFCVQLWKDTGETPQRPAMAAKLESEATLHPPSGTRVVGFDATGASGGEELYLLEASARELSSVARSGSRSLIKTSSSITDVTMASCAPALALCTEDGQVIVIDHAGAERYRGRMGQ